MCVCVYMQLLARLGEHERSEALLVEKVDRLEGDVAAAQLEAAEARAKRQEMEGEVGRLRMAVEEMERERAEAERRWGAEANRREAAWEEEKGALKVRMGRWVGALRGWMVCAWEDRIEESCNIFLCLCSHPGLPPSKQNPQERLAAVEAEVSTMETMVREQRQLVVRREEEVAALQKARAADRRELEGVEELRERVGRLVEQVEAERARAQRVEGEYLREMRAAGQERAVLLRRLEGWQVRVWMGDVFVLVWGEGSA